MSNDDTTTSPAGRDVPEDPARHLGWVLAALMLTLLLAALDQTIVSTALPTITSELGGLAHLSWVVTAYLLAATASTPIWGKISDLYGRKLLLQAAVVLFVISSALAGLSQTMGALIATRALQGLGGGGLMVLVMAVLADLVPPRERGRYSGMFGAVFGLASIVGPLLGGFFTEELSWRWIFYINLPLGVAAFLVLGAVLHLPRHRSRHTIDWLGAAVLVAGVTALLLVTVWGGREYDWLSPQVLSLAAVGVAALAVFVWQELRAREPIVSMSLFRNRVFTVTSAIGFLVGFAMFGAIVYLPIYLQVVTGSPPTRAGLELLPLMAGLVTTSIASGLIIARTGRYKIFPVVGTALATLGLFLLSRLGTDTPYWQIALGMLVLGTGIGNVMQVLLLAVQNAVPVSELGAATSASAFFRSIGGSFGTAVFGAVWAGRLAAELDRALPPGARPAGDVTSSLGAIRALPAAVQESVLAAFARSIDTTFLVAVPIMALGVVLALLLPEVPLRRTHGVDEMLADDAAVPLPANE